MRRCLTFPLLAGLLVGCRPEPARTALEPRRLPPVPMPPTLVFPEKRATPVQAPPHVPPSAQRSAPPAAQARTTSNIPRDWIPSSSPRDWEFIVIHHSDTVRGSAASFDQYHRRVKRWDSLGYHFVIGNGNGTSNGLVEVGPRWRYQQVGAHAGSLIHNEGGIGICMVGDFDAGRPTSAQMQSLAKLVGHLMRTYRIPATRVIGHNSFRHTNCPGRNLSIATVRQLASRYAQADPLDLLPPLPSPSQLAVGELLHETAQ